MRTTYQNTSMRFGFFRAWDFRAQNPECYGFFWQCKRYNKKPQVFWILVFANVNGPTDWDSNSAMAFLGPGKKNPRQTNKNGKKTSEGAKQLMTDTLQRVGKMPYFKPE